MHTEASQHSYFARRRNERVQQLIVLQYATVGSLVYQIMFGLLRLMYLEANRVEISTIEIGEIDVTSKFTGEGDKTETCIKSLML